MKPRPSIPVRFGVAITLVAASLGSVLWAAESAPALTASARLGEAEKAYRAGDFASALEHYREVSDSLESAVVLYNRGVAAFKSGRLGEALQSTEKALRLTPRDAAVRTNFTYMKARVRDSVPEDEPDPFSRVLWAGLDRVTIDELAIAFALPWWAAWAALALRHRSSTPDRKGFWTRTALVLGAAALLVGLCLALKVHDREASPAAYVLKPEVEVRSGPSDTDIRRFTLHEGTRVMVVLELPGKSWYQIALANGQNGWIPASAIGRL